MKDERLFLGNVILQIGELRVNVTDYGVQR